jgi:hypothetical protein
MAAGAWVFPIAILGFFGFFTGFLYTNPAEPVPLTTVRPGMLVTVEYTEYYGEDGYASFTTDQELYLSGQLRAGPDAPVGYDPGPFVLRVPNETTPRDSDVAAALLGRRANDTFTTPIFTNYYGDFTDQRTFDRNLVTFDAMRTWRNGGPIPGGMFNYTRFVDFWSAQQNRQLRVGDEVRCEGDLPWRCRIETLDAPAGTVTFRRTLDPNASISPQFIFNIAPGTPPPAAIGIVETTDGRLALRWTPPIGQRFAVLEGPTQAWQPGAYRVDAVEPNALRMSYTREFLRADNSPIPPHLIGEPVWYEITIVRIDRT